MAEHRDSYSTWVRTLCELSVKDAGGAVPAMHML
jgi:hypothetical protein